MVRQKASAAQGLAALIERNAWSVVGVVLVVTAALSYPMLFWASSETASQSPRTEITETHEIVAERFADDVFRYFLLIEAKDGNILSKGSLLALLANEQEMRSSPAISDRLVKTSDRNTGVMVDGVWSLADATDQLLQGIGVEGGIAEATQDQIDGAIAALLQRTPPSDWGLATQTAKDDTGIWSSPAVFVSVAADNAELGGAGFLVTIGTDDLEKELFARQLRSVLAGDGASLEVWAPAADVNLTSQDQGELAGPFIGATIMVVLLIIGLSFGSYWAVAIAGAALAMLMVWLQGGANLIGLKSDQILSTLLPISMISFGVDSAFHGIGRVREERTKGGLGRRSFVIGLGSVLGALGLAAASDAVAFLANTTAGIESVVQFGLAASLATVVAFFLLGVVTPLLLSLIEGEDEPRSVTRFGKPGDLVLSLIAAALATATVAVLLFLSIKIGLAMLVGYLLIVLVLPWLIMRRGRGVVHMSKEKRRWAGRLGELVAGVASRPVLTLSVVGMVTCGALWSAMQLSVTFDVKDFFSSDSDFVIALDKTAEYLGDQGGEPATVYVESDLTSRSALDAIAQFTDRVAAAPDNPLARGADGVVLVDAGLLRLVDAFDDQLGPQAAIDLSSLYAEALVAGFSSDVGPVVWSANEVGTVLWQSEDTSRQATVLRYQIPDTRDQANVVRVREILEPAATVLERALQLSDPDATVVVTGSAIYRDDQLAGIRRSMLLALPIAVAACLLLSIGFMKSVRYGVATVIPILLVVSWLYGLMHQAGFAVNVVTSIIGAVSVGIGIDFSTHFTMRFLEERRSGASTDRALAVAGRGTGSALTGSAMTSVAGFGILAFAPMPMFATYGLLTAIMIVLALIASLFVLPSLLAVVTTDTAAQRGIGDRTGALRLDVLSPLRLGLSRDLSDGVVDRVLEVCEDQLRQGGLGIRSVPGPELINAIQSGAVDVGLLAVWPGVELPEVVGIEVIPLAIEDLVAVGGSTLDQDVVSLREVVRNLVILGPHDEAEAGLRAMARADSRTPFLAHSVAQVRTGLQIAAITGGTMILPRTMAVHAGGLPVRPFDPPAVLQTLLLVAHDRAGDSDIFELAAGISRSLQVDERLDTSLLGPS